MDELLAFATKLEEHDAAIAASLGRVEARQHEVETLRLLAASVAAFLESLPEARELLAREERAALDDRAHAQTSLREAEAVTGDARERALERARLEVAAAEAHVADAAAARQQLAGREAQAELDVQAVRTGTAELSATLPDLPPPADDLPGAAAWLSQARGALLVERSTLASAREQIVRQASELLGSVLGEPLTATSVAGLRARLEGFSP